MKFRKFKYDKLVRDKIIEKYQKEGSIFHIKKLNDQEFSNELKNKLLEETNEVVEAKTNQELIQELADVLEVVNSICLANNFTYEDVLNAKNIKYEERGGFEGRNFVISAEHPENSYCEKYCLNNIDRYPEIKD